jgi:hypothetical protein
MTYKYLCSKCDHTWEEKLSIADRNNPLDLPCLNCKEKGRVTRVFEMPALVSTSPDILKKAGSGWNDVLKKIKKGSGSKNTIRTR